MSAPQSTGRSRDAKGKWLKGTPSPNPGGRPATPREVAAYFAAHTIAAAEKVVALMNDADADPQDQLRAAMHVLDRSLGKPMQALDVTAHRGPDVGAPGGQPDAARAKLEALIATAQAATAQAAAAAPGHGVDEGERDCESGGQRQIAEGLPSFTTNGSVDCPTVAPGAPPEGAA